MAYLWPMSLIPRYDESGKPLVGAKAYFFDHGTTTPMLVYTTAAFSEPHDHPVPANSRGAWPAVFIEEGKTFRLRTTTADGVTLDDVDGISVPTLEPPEFPSSDTPPEQLFQTGHLMSRWSATAPNGWVRCNGRTIGAAASGATERANADCEDLFIFLWNNDVNLVVSGGRGGTANGDWSGGKQIALPSFRGRAQVGPDSFGNSAAGVLTDAVFGADSDLLGAVGGAAEHTLTTGQVPSHTHTGTTSSDGNHKHTVPLRASDGSAGSDMNRLQVGTTGQSIISDFTNMQETGAHTHTFTTSSSGDGGAHNNVQPSIVVTTFIKL